MADLRSMIDVEIQREERVYRVQIPLGAPYAECYEVVAELEGVIKEMQRRAEEHAKKLENQDVEQPVEAEVAA